MGKILNKLKVLDYELKKNIYYIVKYKSRHPKIDYNSVDKILIVAHPDDEVLFFSRCILNDKKILVVCMTNGGNIVRSKEFIGVMKVIGINYKMFNLSDGFDKKWYKRNVINKLKPIINRKQWKMIITHNEEGEYGHIQHKQLNEIIRGLSLNNVFTSEKNSNLICEKNKLSDFEYKNKLRLSKQFYQSQYKIINSLEKYVKYEGVIKLNK